MYSVDSEKKTPTVISYTMGRIGVRSNDNYSLEYALFMNRDEPEENVFFAREYDVTPDGRLTSPISSYYRYVLLRKTFGLCVGVSAPLY